MSKEPASRGRTCTELKKKWSNRSQGGWQKKDGPATSNKAAKGPPASERKEIADEKKAR